tara:strand:+ start:353 stop:808 length:456 start_codon:yes stop_codon:yes gene_type:complete
MGLALSICRDYPPAPEADIMREVDKFYTDMEAKRAANEDALIVSACADYIENEEVRVLAVRLCIRMRRTARITQTEIDRVQMAADLRERTRCDKPHLMLIIRVGELERAKSVMIERLTDGFKTKAVLLAKQLRDTSVADLKESLASLGDEL